MIEKFEDHPDSPIVFVDQLPQAEKWLCRLHHRINEHPMVGTKGYCPTGGVYDTVVWTTECDYIQPEGTGGATYFENPDIAWFFWVMAFEQYKRTRRGTTLYWRQKPAFWKLSYKSDICCVYARLFIADIDE